MTAAPFNDTAFETVGLIGRYGSDQAAETIARVRRCLEGRGVTTLVETPSVALFDEPVTSAGRDELGERCDLLVVVGGDGSLLGVARELAHTGIPVLGVNRGTLGFLADISPDDVERAIGEVLDGRFLIEERFLLDAEVRRDGERIGAAPAMNDVVVHAGSLSRMMEFTLYVDGEFVYEQRSDGLIIATPTGSTAYALSAGGPIMHPRLDAICIVPMFPHTLTSRPLVVQGDCEISLVFGDYKDTHPAISCDSQVDIEARPGDRVLIRKRPGPLRLLHPPEHSFYESCRSKLDWGTRLGDRRNGGG